MIKKFIITTIISLIICGGRLYGQSDDSDTEVKGFSEFIINEPLTIARMDNLQKTSYTDTLWNFVYTGDCCKKFVNNIDIEQIQLSYAKKLNSENVFKLKKIQIFLDTLTLRGRLNGTLNLYERETINVDRDRSKASAIVNLYSNKLGTHFMKGNNDYFGPYISWLKSNVLIIFWYNWLGENYGSAPVILYTDFEYFNEQNNLW